MKALRKIINVLVYGKWTDCSPHDWHPIGFADWRCVKCGADR